MPRPHLPMPLNQLGSDIKKSEEERCREVSGINVCLMKAATLGFLAWVLGPHAVDRVGGTIQF